MGRTEMGWPGWAGDTSAALLPTLASALHSLYPHPRPTQPSLHLTSTTTSPPPLTLLLQTTIGIEFATKTVNIDGQVVKAQIWDTAGRDGLACSNCCLQGSWCWRPNRLCRLAFADGPPRSQASVC